MTRWHPNPRDGNAWGNRDRKSDGHSLLILINIKGTRKIWIYKRIILLLFILLSFPNLINIIYLLSSYIICSSFLISIMFFLYTFNIFISILLLTLFFFLYLMVIEFMAWSSLAWFILDSLVRTRFPPLSLTHYTSSSRRGRDDRMGGLTTGKEKMIRYGLTHIIHLPSCRFTLHLYYILNITFLLLFLYYFKLFITLLFLICIYIIISTFKVLTYRSNG